ncbi:MAG TPA: histidine kinase [Streptosporangiaceae bacterium]|nr:histidine kinase [Streptosporangiaceae bacterium]
MNDALSCGLSPDRPAGSAARGGPGLPVTAVVIAAIGSLTALTIWGEFATQTAARLLALDVVAGVVACALLPVLLRWPVPGALALAALAVASPAATPAATFGTLYVAQRRRFAVAAAVGAVGVVTHAVRGLWRPISGLPFAWWLILVVVAEAALVGWGQLTQARRALIASLQDRARRAEAEQGRRVAEARAFERTRIAREMHDVLAHRLSLLATYAGAIEYRPDAPPEQLAQAAGVVRAGAHQALDELREVITVLRGDVGPDDDDQGQRPQPGLADLPRLVGESRDAGENVQLDDRVSEPAALPGAAGRTAYRVIQEGLTNARKHAPGQPVQVVLDGRPGDRLLIDIRNPLRDGRSAPAAMAGSGTGLIGLTERVRLAGGELDQQITPAGEFRLCARLPWPA